jgi:hypothetical protein
VSRGSGGEAVMTPRGRWLVASFALAAFSAHVPTRQQLQFHW